MSELESVLRNLKNVIKITGALGHQTVELKQAISSLLSARINLGQTLYFSYKEFQRWNKQNTMSLSQFLKAIAAANPQIKYRTYQRSFRIYERLIIEAGLWIEDIETVDFVVLARIAEGKHLTPYHRRDIVRDVLKMMESGFNYRDTSKFVTESLKFYKEHPKRWTEGQERTDRRMADVKLNVGLAQSEIDKMDTPNHGSVPINLFEGVFPHVDKSWLNKMLKRTSA